MKFVKASAFLSSLAFASAALVAPVNAQSSSQTVEFSWAGETFSMPIPQGYCLPTGDEEVMSQQIAAGDSANETMVDLHICGSYGQGYIIIKTPRALPAINLPKATFTELVAKETQGTAAQEGIEQGARDVDEMSGGQISVDNQDYGFAGYDGDCAYMAGTMQLAAAGQSLDVRVGSCLTLVGTRNFAVHVYDNRTDGESVEALRARSLVIAQSIEQQ